MTTPNESSRRGRGRRDHGHPHDERHERREHHRGRGRRRGGRASRGDVRAAVLQLLAEEPMHGYQLMQAIADRTGGRWTPSPGTIYPTLSQLADEGLIVVTTESGRKLATLTDEGRAHLERDQENRPDPFAGFDSDGPDVDLRGLLGELHGAVRQIGRSGDLDQRTAAAKVLTDARRSIYLLLADGPTQQTDEG